MNDNTTVQAEIEARCRWEEEKNKYARPCDGASIFRVEEQLRIAMNGHPESELWGEQGLIAATMRCVEAVGKIEDLVTTDHETKESFIQRVRSIISPTGRTVSTIANEYSPHTRK